MIILGSTGSIGKNALEIAYKYRIKIEAMSAGQNVADFKAQLQQFSPKFAYICDRESAELLSKHSPRTKFFYGKGGLSELVAACKSTKLLNAIVGFAGLEATLTAQECGKKVALANKESLVVAGKFIDTKKIFPVDSEHFALWYLLGKKKPKKMIITASGGALRDEPLEKMASASVSDVLKHPNWLMGKKITVDSATMANKLLELMEARWLFGEKIEYDAVIEQSSSVHAFLEYRDGITTAKMSRPDMKLPIGYAMLGKYKDEVAPIELTKLGKLEFREIDIVRYPMWALKKKLLNEPDMGVVFNAANEIAVEKFLQGDIAYRDMPLIVFRCIEAFNGCSVDKVDDLYKIDEKVREYAKTISKA